MQNEENMGNYKQGGLYGVCHGEFHKKNAIIRMTCPTHQWANWPTLSTRWEGGVHHLGMAFAILCEGQEVRK